MEEEPGGSFILRLISYMLLLHKQLVVPMIQHLEIFPFNSNYFILMTKFTKTIFVLALAIVSANAMTAQAPFWTEDFANGIPADWTNEDPSGNNALWTWCANPETGQSNGCPAIFDDATNNQVPFAATTATNGFATMDSDLLGNLNTNHLSQLTTSGIDCSSYNEVYIRFETHIGVYTVGADVGALLRISTDDGATWTPFTVFPNLTTQERWSDNPEIVILDISSVAAGQANVKIQWQWEGNYEYMWSLDDISLFDADPTPSFSIELGDFFYAPASFAQPISQVGTDTMGFFADVSNVGASEVTNIVLKATINDVDNNVLFADSIIIPALAAGVLDSTFVLDNQFVPDMLDVGTYSINYSAYSMDNPDANPADNEDGDLFVVTENLYSKENGSTIAYRPGGGPADYMVGNVYQTSNNWVDEYKATEVTFSAVKNAADGTLAGDQVNIVFLEMNEDELDPDWGNFDDTQNFFTNPATILKAFVPHTWEADEQSAVESEMLIDFDLETPGVNLKPGNRYMVLCSYEGDNNVAFQSFSEEISYFQISTVVWDGGDNQWFLGGFGPEPAAFIRLAIDLVNTTDEKPLPDNALKFYPNPANSVLNVELSLEQPTLANVTIAEINGRVIRIDEIENAHQENLQYDVSKFPSGTYLVRVATEEGTSTKQFVVQH